MFKDLGIFSLKLRPCVLLSKCNLVPLQLCLPMHGNLQYIIARTKVYYYYLNNWFQVNFNITNESVLRQLARQAPAAQDAAGACLAGHYK